MMTDFFMHPNALVESQNIGKKTRIWAFAHILPNAIIGEDCNICDHVFIENDVIVGNRVTIKSGVQLWDGVILEDDVFVGPNATFTNDQFPRSKHYPKEFQKTIVKKGASIGANATILPGITIGQYAMIGAGSVVTKDVPPFAILVGNPARIVGYVRDKFSNQKLETTKKNTDKDLIGVENLGVGNSKLLFLPIIRDMRGSLSYAEKDQFLPFVPQRYFLVFDVPSKEVRGEHAHRECHQFLVCVKGACTVVLDNGKERVEIRLDSPNIGVYIPPMIWALQYNYSSDAVLMVLASHKYDPNDYIRDYEEYLKEVMK